MAQSCSPLFRALEDGALGPATRTAGVAVAQNPVLGHVAGRSRVLAQDTSAPLELCASFGVPSLGRGDRMDFRPYLGTQFLNVDLQKQRAH